MIVGDSDIFAIECSITQVFPSSGQRALGYFVIYVRGKAFGVRAPNATLLACSFDAVKERLSRRGSYRMPYLSDIGAPSIVEAVVEASYGDETRTDYFGRTGPAFRNDIRASDAQWAPDGDAAFDDGGHVLQFDIEDKVRLIAFHNVDHADERAKSIVEEWIASDIFYGILRDWSETFEQEWSDRLRGAKGGTAPS